MSNGLFFSQLGWESKTYVPLKKMQKKNEKLRASHFGVYSEKVHFKNYCIFVFLI